MRSYRRNYERYKTPYCSHMREDEYKICYCNLGEVCLQICDYYTPTKIKRLSNKECKIKIHQHQKLMKSIRRGEPLAKTYELLKSVS